MHKEKTVFTSGDLLAFKNLTGDLRPLLLRGAGIKSPVKTWKTNKTCEARNVRFYHTLSRLFVYLFTPVKQVSYKNAFVCPRPALASLSHRPGQGYASPVPLVPTSAPARTDTCFSPFPNPPSPLKPYNLFNAWK